MDRVCPGRFIGLDFVWIVTVSLLATYNITKATDENGKVIEPEIEYTSILTRYAYALAFGATCRNSGWLSLAAVIPNHSNAVYSLDQKKRRYLLNRHDTS